MHLIEQLAKTPEANKRFKAYYIASGWSLKIPFSDFLKIDFRYQCGVFLDYLRKENYEINVAWKGYIIYVHSPDLMEKADRDAEIMFHLVENGWYYVDCKEVPHEPHVTRDIQLQEVTKAAILVCFQQIHSSRKGFNKNFNPLKDTTKLDEKKSG